MTPEQAARFWAKVDKSGECWVWTGATGSGYGRLTLAGEGLYAHRVSFAEFNGPIPEGMDVMHACDNPPCVRPEHLSLGTRQDNMADAKAKGRMRNGVSIGSSNGSAKLTEDQVREIRTIYARGGIGQTRIARQFGVSRSAIEQVVHALKWRGVSTEPIRIDQRNPRWTTCARGHTLVEVGPRRVCRECGRRRSREYEERKRHGMSDRTRASM